MIYLTPWKQKDLQLPGITWRRYQLIRPSYWYGEIWQNTKNEFHAFEIPVVQIFSTLEEAKQATDEYLLSTERYVLIDDEERVKKLMLLV